MRTLAIILLALLSGSPALASDERGGAPGFWHVGLLVADLDLMDRFYGEVIGLRNVTDLLVEDANADSGAEGAIVVERLDTLMAVTGVRIEIRHYSGPRNEQFLELLHYPDHPAESVDRWTNRPYGLGHLGIRVPAMEPVLERMRATGLGDLVSGPQLLEEFGGLRYAFLKDPEGNLVELMETATVQDRQNPE